MRERLRRALVGVLVLALVGAPGCGHELVRVSIEPPAVTVDAPPRDPLRVAVRCVSPPGEQERLLEALRGCGAFQGPLLEQGERDGPEARVVARLDLEVVSQPEIITGARWALAFFSHYFLWFLAPFNLVWTDREPDLVEKLTLELAVPGEAPAGRYKVVARGTLSAQSPEALNDTYKESAEQRILDEHRPAFRAEALRALASHVARDEAALRRLAEQLDETPPTALEPLLVAEETHLPRATWRTRRLIAWKASSLDGLLAEAKVAELRALVGKVEACMVELARGAELSKDSAEATVAAAGGSGGLSRGLSLAYRERLEVLRPILEALKGELDARKR